ncbi:hypothetical protein CYMTET_11858 [Cymbomonas tetramitiformis]|uniref:Malate synthase C-terminal domain-containing protein n=1 Tax=Cymbomonas tetramitiformis TaxID=36881 RepID=A0AAE0LD20_9CHLO|nr:hypothetical protein CYMTET_11858 [Cymbomonas tetramitiformis]
MLLEYLEGWLDGRGAKGINSMVGRPGSHATLMEDLATARISVAQVAQRLIHCAKCADSNEIHTLGLVNALLKSECDDIIHRLRQSSLQAPQVVERYRQARWIAQQWIRRYTKLDFTSLGQYNRDELRSWAVRSAL